ncbi:hypothetical protein KW791_01090 [Candidatus Parcubacteria bacterium]|nr:hypothetical protein [Candidatus Parcubacteria bacterium]
MSFENIEQSKPAEPKAPPEMLDPSKRGDFKWENGVLKEVPTSEVKLSPIPPVEIPKTEEHQERSQVTYGEAPDELKKFREQLKNKEQ